jgi:CDP-glycerol glycerophosphotransferase (TagB/SpsB family)
MRTALDALRPARIFEFALSTALHSKLVRSRYGGAWVLMDRDTEAGDSAEYLYRYIRQHHPEINAWFVIKKNSSDWARLKADDVRLVPYGSWRWQLLLFSAAHVASSHVDKFVLVPLEPKRFGPPRWRFSFLEHGVIKDDLSRWLNSKPLDLFVASSEAEYESIVGDGTPYVFTSKEVKLTGLPRHDALIAKREMTPASSRNLILIMPTWRLNLVGEAVSSGNDRRKRSGFAQSNYAVALAGLLHSDGLRAFAKLHGLDIVFMPHPNMRPYLADFDAPDYVKVVSYDDEDIQQLLARGRLFITDYSSIAFNAAAIELRSLYFQFDQREFFSGSHTGRRGYFDYERDGFGPVCVTLTEFEAALETLLLDDEQSEEYLRRMRDVYVFHDCNNSARVFEAIRALDDPAPPVSPVIGRG